MFERQRERAADGGLAFDATSMLGLAAESPNLVLIAVDGRIAFANRAASRFMDARASGELEGRALVGLIHEADRETAGAMIARIRDGEEPPVWTSARLLTVDGRPLDLEVTVTPAEFSGERGLIVLGRDVREAHRALEALRESERRFQSLAAAAPVAIHRLDADGRCVYLNKRWSELTGIPVEEALGKSWLDLVSERALPLASETWRRIVALPSEHRAEHDVNHRDGTTRRVLTQLLPETDASGRVVGWIGSMTDLTDLKHAEYALARSEERLRLALQAANMATWDVDLDAGRIHWSENATRALGILDGTLPVDLAHGWTMLDPARVTFRSGSAKDSLESGEPFEFEVRFEHPEKKPRWAMVRGQALPRASGEGRRIVGIVVDETARREAANERARLEQKLVESQRLESLGLLAGGVAHDFNNLLVGMLGNAELALARLGADAPARALVEGIRDAGVRAAEITRQILAYSGNEPVARGAVDLAALVRETVALLRGSLPSRARVALEGGEGLPCVEGDATQLRQVLMNLLVNAGESLPDGAGEVRIRLAGADVREGDAPGGAGFLELEIVDSGAGMDAQTRARIFDPFFTTRAGGRGLGLAVVHGIVRAHGGTIEVESEPLQGTRMRVRLPATASRPARPSDARRLDAPVAAAAALVLVVDDERAVRDVIRLALESAGHRALLAGSTVEALARLEAHGAAIDAIVLDLTLGSQTSEPVLAEIRARSADVPVLVTSGYPEEQALARLAELGVAAFVPKPFTPARLLDGLARALAARAR